VKLPPRKGFALIACYGFATAPGKNKGAQTKPNS
jgi:hypothetical protein